MAQMQQTIAPARAMSGLDWAKLIALGAIWGGSFFFAGIAVTEIHPLTLVLLRVAIAAAALQVYGSASAAHRSAPPCPIGRASWCWGC